MRKTGREPLSGSVIRSGGIVKEFVAGIGFPSHRKKDGMGIQISLLSGWCIYHTINICSPWIV